MQSNNIYASLLVKVPLCSQVASILDGLEQKYQQLITPKKWEGVGHIGANHTINSPFKAAVTQDEEEQSYAAYVKSKSCLPFDDWAKFQTCCRYGHVRPLCKKFLAEKANGTLPQEARSTLVNRLPITNQLLARHKFNKDPKLKALLSAFAAFTSNYIDKDSQDMPYAMKNADEDDKDNGDNLHAFLGLVGSLKE
jgi:hypothetical protein